MTERTVLVRLKGDISDYNRAMLAGVASTKAFTKELDTSNDRMTNLTQSALALGPALVPIGAAAVPAISGLTNQLAFAAAGAGVTALAFSGVGDALKAVNDYQLEPTTANFEKLQETMSELGPAGRQFVLFLQQIRPELQGLQDAAQAGLLPGAEDGIRELMVLMPQAERIVSEIAGSLGDLIAEAGDNLNDPRWVEFFAFLETEARPTLIDMGRTLGNFAEGFANLWMAFDPLSDSFSASFLQMSRDFALWTDGLDDTDDFQEFLDYIERTGPQVWETLSAIGNALLQIVEAAAPVGEASLPIIEAVADVLSLIADSPAGPVLIGAAAGISALSRAVALYNVANGSAMSSMITKLGGKGAVLRSTAAGVGLVALSMTDLDEKMGLTNTATLALAGSFAGPWGAAIGGGIGLVKDLSAAGESLNDAFDKATNAITNNNVSLEQQDALIEGLRKKAADQRDNFGIGHSTDDENDRKIAALAAIRDKSALAARGMRFEEAGLTSALAGTSDATLDQVDAILKLMETRNRAANELLTARDAERALEAAIDDATAAVKENGRTHDEGTEKGRANNAALDEIAKTWNNLSAEQQNNTALADRVRESFIKTAMDAGRLREAAEKLANAELEIPTDIGINITQTGALTATKQAKDLRTALLKIPRITETTIRTIQETFILPPKSKSDRTQTLEEMLGGRRKASGGYISGPGGPRDDAIPAWLSNGEYVINAAATRANLPLLHEINSERFAGGGLASRYSGGPDYSRARPMSGGYAPNVAPAPSQPVAVRMSSGALEIKGGKAYVEGIADVLYSTRKDWESTRVRASGR